MQPDSHHGLLAGERQRGYSRHDRSRARDRRRPMNGFVNRAHRRRTHTPPHGLTTHEPALSAVGTQRLRRNWGSVTSPSLIVREAISIPADRKGGIELWRNN